MISYLFCAVSPTIHGTGIFQLQANTWTVGVSIKIIKRESSSHDDHGGSIMIYLLSTGESISDEVTQGLIWSMCSFSCVTRCFRVFGHQCDEVNFSLRHFPDLRALRDDLNVC